MASNSKNPLSDDLQLLDSALTSIYSKISSLLSANASVVAANSSVNSFGSSFSNISSYYDKIKKSSSDITKDLQNQIKSNNEILSSKKKALKYIEDAIKIETENAAKYRSELQKNVNLQKSLKNNGIVSPQLKIDAFSLSDKIKESEKNLNKNTFSSDEFLKDIQNIENENKNIVGQLHDQNMEYFESIGFISKLGSFFETILGRAFELSNITQKLAFDNGVAADNMDVWTNSIDDANVKFAEFGVSMEKAGEASDALIKTFGNASPELAKNVDYVSLLSSQMGIASEDTSKVLYNLSSMTGESIAQTENYLNSYLILQKTSKGLIFYKNIFKDIASLSASTLILFKGNKKELMESAIEARSYGTNINEVAENSDKLLDFQQDIDASLKYKVLTGKTINTLELARYKWNKDYTGLMNKQNQIIMSQWDSLSANAFSMKEGADALGMSVDQLQKMHAQGVINNDLNINTQKIIDETLKANGDSLVLQKNITDEVTAGYKADLANGKLKGQQFDQNVLKARIQEAMNSNALKDIEGINDARSEENKLMDQSKSFMTDISSIFTKNIMEDVKDLIESLHNILGYVHYFTGGIKSIDSYLGNWPSQIFLVAGAFTLLWFKIYKILKTVSGSGFIKGIGEMFTSIGEMFTSIGEMFTSIGETLMTYVINPGLNFLKSFGNSKVFSTIGEYFMSWGKTLISYVIRPFTFLWEYILIPITEFVETTLGVSFGVAGGIIAAVIVYIGSLIYTIYEDWNKIIESWTKAPDVLSGIENVISRIGLTLIKALVKPFTWVIDLIIRAFGGQGTLSASVDDFFEWLNNEFYTFHAYVSGLIFKLFDYLSSLIKPIKWSDWIPSINWNSIISILSWTSYLTPIKWSDWIPSINWNSIISILSWTSYLTPIKWSDWIPSINWNSIISILSWTSYLTPIAWGTWIPTLNWGTWIPTLNWGTWIPTLNWGTWIPTLNWGTWIPTLNWNSIISILSWTSYLTPIKWSDWIPSINWNSIISILSWTSYLTPIAWGTWIPTLNWGTWIPTLNWSSWVPSFNWSNWFGDSNDAQSAVPKVTIDPQINPIDYSRIISDFEIVGDKISDIINNIIKGIVSVINTSIQSFVSLIPTGLLSYFTSSSSTTTTPSVQQNSQSDNISKYISTMIEAQSITNILLEKIVFNTSELNSNRLSSIESFSNALGINPFEFNQMKETMALKDAKGNFNSSNSSDNSNSNNINNNQSSTDNKLDILITSINNLQKSLESGKIATGPISVKVYSDIKEITSQIASYSNQPKGISRS